MGKIVTVEVIYLSGPISLGGTLSSAEVKANIARFKSETARLDAMGFEVLDPTTCPKCDSWEAYMKLCIPMVCRADALAKLPGWELSPGAIVEELVARIIGIEIIEVDQID